MAIIYPRLHIFLGPMFSGKTSRMLEMLESAAAIHNAPSLLLVHSFDDRTELTDGLGGASTHSEIRRGRSSRIIIDRVDVLSTLELPPCVAVGVDEANFFHGNDLRRAVEAWMRPSATAPRLIVLAALDSDMAQRVFCQSLVPLFPAAEKVVKSSAVCIFCAKDGVERAANYTIRITALPNPHSISSLSGGNQHYAAVCDRHRCLSSVSPAELDDWLFQKKEHHSKTCACFQID